MTMTSTVGWMALLANKPLLILNISSTSDWVNISKRDGALLINSLDKLEEGLKLMLNDSPLSKVLRKNRMYLPRFDNPTKSIVNIIEKMYWSKNA